MRRQSAHVDASVLAELSAGLIDGKRATRIHAHLAGCQRCAQLSADLTEVSVVLSAAPVPVMPDAVLQRLNATIAGEAAARSGTVSFPARAQDRAARHAERLRTQAPRNRRRILASPVAARSVAAAAAACLVAAGGYSAVQLSSSGGSPATAAPGTGQSASRSNSPRTSTGGAQPYVRPTANGPAAEGVDSPAGTSFKVVESGINYQPASLSTQISAELGTVSGGAQVRYAPTRTQLACVQLVTGGTVPSLVDRARYRGQPATVIAMAQQGNQFGQAWVVGSACSGTKSDILTHVKLSPAGR